MKTRFLVLHDAARQAAIKFIYSVPIGHEIIIKPGTRTQDQNDRLWPKLRDIAEQVEWYGQRLTEEEWKDVFTAALKRSKVVPGIDGGFVVVGLHTSRLTKDEMSSLLELIEAFGAEHEVEWSENHDTHAAI